MTFEVGVAKRDFFDKRNRDEWRGDTHWYSRPDSTVLVATSAYAEQIDHHCRCAYRLARARCSASSVVVEAEIPPDVAVPASARSGSQLGERPLDRRAAGRLPGGRLRCRRTGSS